MADKTQKWTLTISGESGDNGAAAQKHASALIEQIRKAGGSVRAASFVRDGRSATDLVGMEPAPVAKAAPAPAPSPIASSHAPPPTSHDADPVERPVARSRSQR